MDGNQTRSLLAGLALLGAFGLGLLAQVAPGRSTAQGKEPTAAATGTTASALITPIWQGDPSQYQNQQESEREQDSTCCPTSIATVLNASYMLLLVVFYSVETILFHP